MARELIFMGGLDDGKTPEELAAEAFAALQKWREKQADEESRPDDD